MSFARYPEYRDSGVDCLGEVPSHWDLKPLKHLAGIDSCGSYGVEPDAAEIALPVATTAQIDSDGRFAVDRMPLRGFTSAEVQRFGCLDGDILVVKSSGSATNIISGKAGLVDESTASFVFSNFLMRVRPRKELVTSKYAYALLRSHLTRQRVEQMCATTTYPNLQVAEYCSALLPIPPLPEQAQIAAFIDRETAKIDALVGEQQRLMELLKEKRQAVISHAVTKGLNPDSPMKPSGVEWLGDVPEHWEVVPLKKLVTESVAGPYGASLTKGMYCESGYRVYGQQQVIPDDFTIGDYYIDQKKFLEMERYTVFPGDVLVSVMGTIGQVAVVPDDVAPGIINPRLVRYRCGSRIKPRHLQQVLMSRSHQEHLLFESKGSTMNGLNMQTIGAVPVPIPPLIEQDVILNYIAKQAKQFHALTTEAQRAIELLQERRTALISAAVTGQIDVRGIKGVS